MIDCMTCFMLQPVTIYTLPWTNNSLLQLTCVLIVVGVFIKFNFKTLNGRLWLSWVSQILTLLSLKSGDGGDGGTFLSLEIPKRGQCFHVLFSLHHGSHPIINEHSPKHWVFCSIWKGWGHTFLNTSRWESNIFWTSYPFYSSRFMILDISYNQWTFHLEPDRWHEIPKIILCDIHVVFFSSHAWIKSCDISKH